MEGGQSIPLIQKKQIQSQDIKEIVLLLNEPPFKQNLSLVGLDDLNTFDLGDLVFKIFKHLDPQMSLNARQTAPDEIIFQVSEFLKILSYDLDFSAEWESGLLNGDRKVIYPIYYFLLKNLHTLKKQAYLAKFLVPLQVPPGLVGQPELKRLNDQFKELKVEFQVTHEQFQRIESTSLNPSNLKKDIQKLQQQKEQLSTRINVMKTKNANKEEIGPMLQATNLLRKEQEQEGRIMEKIQSHRSQLQNAQNQLMSLQQSLTDARKSLQPNNSPQQMLYAIKSEVRKNREMVRERMTVEYNERLKKLQETEKMLSQAPITQNQLMMLENTMTGLRRAVTQMEERLSKETSKDDKLAIYKSQAALVTKNKEQIMDRLKREEEDMSRLENQIRRKEEQINKIKGFGFKKNKLDDYVSELREKKAKYAKCKTQIQEIKWEQSNMQRTLQLLKMQKSRYEKSFGLVDGEKVMADTNIDNASIEELNRQIQKLMDQIKKKKNDLAPKLQKKKQINSQFDKIQNQYKSKKITFLGTTSKIEEQIKESTEKVNKLREQVEGMDTKIQISKLKGQILESKVIRLNEESDNLKGSGRGACGGAKSYQDYVKTRLIEGEKEIVQLTSDRQKIADKHLPSMEQKKMFGDLKKLLQVKMRAGTGQQNLNKGERISNNVNVLKL